MSFFALLSSPQKLEVARSFTRLDYHVNFPGLATSTCQHVVPSPVDRIFLAVLDAWSPRTSKKATLYVMRLVIRKPYALVDKSRGDCDPK
jgi:hypothetical protein